MAKKNKITGSAIVSDTSDIQKEINIWESRIAKKKDEVSELSIQVQNIKITTNVFLGEYNSRVGLLYVKLDKLKLRAKEYRFRIDLAQGKKISQDDLNSIEKEVNEIFTEKTQKINDLEDEATESSEEFNKFKEKEAKDTTLNTEVQEELKKLYRILAYKFHPDRANDGKRVKEHNRIMAAINEAYKNHDLKTLKKYLRQAEQEDMITKETPEEKLVRLKKDYDIILGIIAKLYMELEDLEASETYKLKDKVDEGKKEGRDLLQELADNIQEEINENQVLVDKLVAEYKKIIESVGH